MGKQSSWLGKASSAIRRAVLLSPVRSREESFEFHLESVILATGRCRS